MRVGAERTVLTALSAVALLFSACEEDGFISPVTGTLDVRISGLPTGVAAAATVTGPRGYSRALTASTTIRDLPVGTYTVAAADVTTAEGRWTPTPATQEANLTVALGQVVAEIAYAIATARMAVSITGLPNGVNADVTVTGPGGFTRALTASAPLELLTPGAYTIVATDVTSGGTTYRPAPMTQAVNLVASPTPVAVNVVYAAAAEGTGSLTVTVDGLPTGVDAAITVTGPAGYNQQVASTRTLGSLPPGTYTITASAVAGNLTTHNPAPPTQSVTVAAGAIATATVTYTATALGLSVQQVTQGLTSPVYLTTPANDNRLFIVEQPGRIRIFKNGALLTTPFLDITSIVQDIGGEEGLLSVAFLRMRRTAASTSITPTTTATSQWRATQRRPRQTWPTLDHARPSSRFRTPGRATTTVGWRCSGPTACSISAQATAAAPAISRTTLRTSTSCSASF
jgi:hypothetical protein